MPSPSPTALNDMLYAMLLAFAVALTFIPRFALAIADVLSRHAAAVEAAYSAYTSAWNGWTR